MHKAMNSLKSVYLAMQIKAASLTTMKVMVIGATGQSGLLIISEALARGYEVIALVRCPEKINIMHEKLKVVQVDILKSEEIAENLKGCDAVLSAIGGRPGIMTPCDIYSKSGEAVVKAMRETGVKRFIAITAWGTKDDPDLPFVWKWVLKPSFLRNIVKDMEIFEDYLLKECSDINYTVVKPPRLTNEPSNGEKIIAKEGQCIANVSNAISRQDVVRFMLDNITSQDYFKKLVSVAMSSEKK
uniref:NAD(P)-binding domain-containing protein n=2 Tax=Biomphalaria glabrata TaxID=6526 RepID=A0A2C9KPT6_BIOGL